MMRRGEVEARAGAPLNGGVPMKLGAIVGGDGGDGGEVLRITLVLLRLGSARGHPGALDDLSCHGQSPGSTGVYRLKIEAIA